MGTVSTESEPNRHAPVWRDPLSAGWRAHRGLLMLRLRWHERRTEPASRRTRLARVHPGCAIRGVDEGHVLHRVGGIQR